MNEAQIEFWNGPGAARWTAQQDALDRALEPVSVELLGRSAPQAGERVVDVGCGCGTTTLALAERVGSTGSVLGVDVSGPMLERARTRAHQLGVSNARFVLGDATEYQFDGRAELLFSRFGVMFFEDPIVAFRNLRSALAPGGRMAFVCFRSIQDNEWIRVPLAAAATVVPMAPPPDPHAPGPHALADGERTRRILIEAGFGDVALEPFDPMINLGPDLDEATRFSVEAGPAARVIGSLDADTADRVRASIRAALTSFASAAGVRLSAATWLVSGHRPKL